MAPLFHRSPTVEILTALARGSLRQDLPRAMRLWVILTSIYGEEDLIIASLPETFTYTEWRDAFFNQTQRQGDRAHHQRDIVPPLHDPRCNCAKTLEQWLWGSVADDDQWRQSFLRLYPMSADELERLLRTGQVAEAPSLQVTGRKGLPEGRLFAVTGKQLQFDFAELVGAGWLQSAPLERQKQRYRKVAAFPELLDQADAERAAPFDWQQAIGNLIATDASDLFEYLGHPIRGVQRLFLDIEYIIPGRLSQQVCTWQQQLAQLWSHDPSPPVQLTYRSARLFGEVRDYWVYPVCICYFQRAPYLFAYGQTPADSKSINWYDFRLDRIEALHELDWDRPELPLELRERYLQQTLPTPENVRSQLAEVWGFDLHSPPAELLVRFDQYFHAHYIANTERANLLTAVSSKTAATLIRNAGLNASEQARLLKIIQSKPKDIYCRVQYRQGDNNVTMRLRAWGSKVEVLLPWSLRNRMAQDVQDTWKLYMP
jgi:CRISPR-associated protein (TIGR03985 family)